MNSALGMGQMLTESAVVTVGLRLTGIAAPMVLDGPMTGEAFRAYVEQVLVPELAECDPVEICHYYQSEAIQGECYANRSS